MRVAYLVNQYPAVSHSFIRREIAALEAQGIHVERFSIRPPPAKLVDPDDQTEQARTHVLLGRGVAGLAVATVLVALTAPGAWLGTLRAAVRLGRRSERGVLRHFIYVAEACLLLRSVRAAGGVSHLHAHFGTNSAAVALFTRLLGGPPYSFTAHGPEEFDHPEELSLPEKIDRAAAVVAVSSFGRSQLSRWVPPTQWPKIHVVHCGVDRSFLAKGPQPVADNRRFVCVGRLAPQKGQLLILEALAGLRAEGVEVEVVLAGDGELRDVIERRIAELGLGSAVRITGWISNETVRAELIAARALLLPSFAEGLPVVLMEALALGRPAITTFVAGIPELVENGVNGWLVPAGSTTDLMRAIKAALATPPAELERMGRAGAAAVAAHHDAAVEAARLAELFQK
ncbi:MAG: colanic acid biosynthesis glycosyltransferase WcaL [Myxococcales bacterium]|nr:colanic acid biosynthesis glycosyltransferase WcaL [Myxococcales bacterium]